MDVYYGLAAAGIAILLLGAGIGIGIAIRQFRNAEALPLLTTVGTQYAAQLAETTTLTETAKGLHEACLLHDPPLATDILRGADTVLRATDSLRRQMESLNQLMVAFQQSRSRKPAQATGPAPQEKQEQGSWSADARKILAGSSPQPKRKGAAEKVCFDLWQYVAVYDGATYPPPTAFELVHCAGTSSDGFSYISKDQPVFEKLIVAVGSPSSLQFFLAQTLHTRPMSVDGEAGYLSVCLFNEKLTGVYRWDSKQCRIALAEQSVTA